MKVRIALEALESHTVRTTVERALRDMRNVGPDDEIDEKILKDLIQGIEFTAAKKASIDAEHKVIGRIAKGVGAKVLEGSISDFMKQVEIDCPKWDAEKGHCKSNKCKTDCNGKLDVPQFLADEMKEEREASERCETCLFAQDKTSEICPWKEAGGECKKRTSSGYVPSDSEKSAEELITELKSKIPTQPDKDVSDYEKKGR